MAIPEGRMSTELVEGAYLPAKDRVYYPLAPYEKGPVAIEDTSKGNLYQTWALTYNTITGVMTLTPEIVGDPVDVLTVLEVIHISFTFDQAGHVTIAYTTETSSYLYWYDTDIGTEVTTDLGADVITPNVVLDDKRPTQNTANDILLWYTKSVGAEYTLYMAVQRERYITAYEMATNLSAGNIRKAGMSDETRLQITLNSSAAGIPTPPPSTGPDPSIIWAGADIYANITGAVGQYSLVYFKMNLEWGDPNEATAYVWLNSVAEYYSWLDGQPGDNEYWMRMNVLSVSGNPYIVIRDADRVEFPQNAAFQMSTTGGHDTILVGIHSSVVGVQSALIKIEICKDNGSGGPDNEWVSRNAHCEVTITP